MLNDFDPAKKNPFDVPLLEEVGDYSGAERILVAINKNMEMYKGYTSNLFSHKDDSDLSFMSSLPVDDIAILINSNSSALQKRTAYKVM